MLELDRVLSQSVLKALPRDCGIPVAEHNLVGLAYADDMILTSPTHAKQQRLFSTLESLSAKVGLREKIKQRRS